MVDDPLFVKMLAAFDPRFKLMCRQTLSYSVIPRAFIELKSKILQTCNNYRFFGSSADCWTSPSGEPYLCVTIHHIERHQAPVGLRSQLIAFRHLPEKHTAETILSCIEGS
jgi:hypothetical protein